MNASTSILGFNEIQGALNVLAALQLTAFLWPQQAPQAYVQDGSSFDFIIIGAGSAGSTIANRLTEIENITVLLIEAGGDPTVESVVPGMFQYLKNASVNWNFATEDDGYSQQWHKNHGADLMRGKALGGTSSINYMLYTRGNDHDFDNWAKITGDNSWNYDNVLPYFKKSERLVDPVLIKSDGGAFHGTDGYLGTSRNYNEEVLRYFEAFKEVGHDIVLDTNRKNPLGYTECMFTIADGVRQSTAQSFLHPIRNRPNLFVLKNTFVSKILFDDRKNAFGVEAILENNETVSFKANKEVIVSAGTINTPKLLMLSGIGPIDHLNSHNIDVISDLPVGQTMQDHVSVFVAQTMGKSPPSKPMDPTNFPFPFITGFARLNKSQSHPDYQTFNFVLNEPSAMLQFCTYFSYLDEICDALYTGSLGREVFFTALYLLYPESRGKVLLRSKDPAENPIVYTGIYSNDEDLDRHALYLQDFLKVQDSTFFENVQSKLILPEPCGCGDFNSTHEYWRCYALCMNVAGFHYSASCPMGVIVDSRLNVFGVQKLRIADASVMPKITGANTNADTIMIGERAADFIKQDHNLV